MDYEKKYKEALERARQFSEKPYLEDSAGIVEYIFPELKESEDERIRKALIRAFKSLNTIKVWSGIERTEILAWLEKQGEKIPVVEFKAKDWYVSKVDGKIYNIKYMGKKPTNQARRLEIEKAAMSATGVIQQEEWFIKGAEWSDKNPSYISSEKQDDNKSVKNIVETWKDMRLEVYQQASGNRHELNYSDVTTKMFSLNDIDDIIEKISEQKAANNHFTPKQADILDKHIDEFIKQNPADNVEPKFKVGDWIVENGVNRNPIQITSFEEDKGVGIKVWFNNGTGTYVDFLKGYHKWTIQDAKDGDVLIGIYGTFIFMGESNGGYCGVLSDNTFIRSTGNNEMTKGLHPATKEQYDALLKAMADAGYTFDFEKKELKKIEQKPVYITDEWIEDYWQHHKVINPYSYDKGEEIQFDHQGFVSFCKKYCKKPAAWSEEDERLFESALDMIEWYSGKNEDKSRLVSDWFKSLKKCLQK